MKRLISFLSSLLLTILVPPVGAEPGAAPILGPGTADTAKELLPPEILDLYRKGEWQNPVVEWPLGQMRWEEEFEAGTKANAGRFRVDETGAIVEAKTGASPAHLIGFPFPEVDPNDPQAGVKILWNYFYGQYNLGSAQVNVDLIWLSRSGLDRKANLDTYFLLYDGQKKKYLPDANPQGFLAQILVNVTSPADLYGTTALTWRYRDARQRDGVWMYLPAMRRVRAMSPANRSDGFLGSELTQDDGQFFDGKPEDFEWKLVGEREMLRLVDPHSLAGDVRVTRREEGGWRGHYAPGAFVGFEEQSWEGSPWAPLQAALAKRPVWIIEGTPRDKYYLFGKVQLVIDRETFQGAWNRKFSWSGELLSIYAVLGYRNLEVEAPDGSIERFWGTGVVYNCAINLKKDRATVTGFPLEKREDARNFIRVRHDPAFFDYQTLQRFGK